MLKGIPNILSPDLLKVLMEMGHGDELVIADGNFPAASLATRLIRCDGNGTGLLLDSVLQLFPLDSFVEHPVALMSVVPGDDYNPDIWPVYMNIIRKHEPKFADFDFIDRFSFYQRTEQAYAVVATGETARYANLVIKKGLIQ